MDRLADFRAVFAQVVLARAGSRDERVGRAFATVPRHEFVGPGPWVFSEEGTPSGSDDPALVYQDVGLGIAAGIPTGLPSLHARALTRCQVREGERVVHVGAGAGYFTAILAELVGARGFVTGFEILPELAAAAARNLAVRANVRVVAESAVTTTTTTTTALEPADLIYVNAGVQQIPRAWLDALRPGGRLLVPITPGDDEGALLLLRRTAVPTAFAAERVCPARFVPCIGTGDDAASAALRAAFARDRGGATIRSFRLLPAEPPDDTGWFCGREGWFSTRPVDAA